MMNRTKSRLRELMRHAGIAPMPDSLPEPMPAPEQSWIDLREAIRVFDAQWSENQSTHADKSVWNKEVAALNAALDALKRAKPGPEAAAKLDAIGAACDSCHKAADWSEPFEWYYSDLKR
jgi:cytochrome c556